MPWRIGRYRAISPLRRPASPPLSRAEYQEWRKEHLWRPSSVEGLEATTAQGAGTWLVHSLTEAATVARSLPGRYEAFARLLFPFAGDDTVREPSTLTWREAASRHGRRWHPLMEAARVAPDETPIGGFTEDQESALASILQRHTSSNVGYFLVWDGWGDLDEEAFPPESAIEVNDARYYTLCGPLEACGEIRFPNYYWPEDRAWCYQVSIDPHDSNCAYLGASRRCIDELLASEAIEVVAVEPTDPAQPDMDKLNPPTDSPT